MSEISLSRMVFLMFSEFSLLTFLSFGAIEKSRQDGLPEERNICQLEVQNKLNIKLPEDVASHQE